ncbi:MAG: PD40 domain-containing protein [Candidatus Zixiibacteriota bacterium]|nr:MAG: PD40 domain-containing protein [candidate division Zixibacteria bacterium]
MTSIIRTVLLSMLIAYLAGCGQDRTQKTEGVSYFGLESPGTDTAIFASSIVTTDNHEHSRIEFSKDGREIYWVTMPVDTSRPTEHGSPYQILEQTIWYSRLERGRWSKPATLAYDIIAMGSPTFSSDGSEFYFRSRDPDSMVLNITWEISHTDSGWTDPVVTDALPLPPRNMSFCFSGNGNLYFDSFGGRSSEGTAIWDIYWSRFENGAYAEPQLVGGGVNDGSMNWTPWVAPDESYIIFSSHREGNLGNGDLYICFRDSLDGWTDAINMGPPVNTASQERFPSVSPDGKFLFFARNNENTYSDIYWISAAFINRLKPD